MDTRRADGARGWRIRALAFCGDHLRRGNTQLDPPFERQRQIALRIGLVAQDELAKLSGPGPPLQCCIPGTMNRRTKPCACGAPIVLMTF